MKKKILSIFIILFASCSPSKSDTELETSNTNLPVFNGNCLYSLEEGLNEIYRIAEINNLKLKINWIEDDLNKYNPDCKDKIVGSNLSQGIDLTNQEKIELVVAIENLQEENLQEENLQEENLQEENLQEENLQEENLQEEKLPSLLTLNVDFNVYKSMEFVSSENELYSYLMNPTKRNPFSAVVKIENLKDPNLIYEVYAFIGKEKINFDYYIDSQTIFVELHFLIDELNFELVFLDSEKQELYETFISLPKIEYKKNFDISKFANSNNWMWIAGAPDGTSVFIDSESNLRAAINLPTNYTRRSLAGNSLESDQLVFFNLEDYKYYSINFFGNYSLWFDNDLDFQYKWHHDTSPSKNKNNYFVLVDDFNQKPFIEDVILEIDIETDEVIRIIDLKDMLDFNLPVIKDAEFEVDEGPENEYAFDWFHSNSIEYVPDRNEIILSGRHLGLIGLDYDSLELNWFLPHNPQYYETIKHNYPILKSKVNNFIPPNGQHNLTFIENKLVYFDNQAIPETFNGKKDYNPYDLKSYFVVLDVDFENLEIINQTIYSHEDSWSKVRGGVDYIDSSFQNRIIAFGGIFYDEFGARTLSRQTNPKTFSWSVVEYEGENLIRTIEGSGRGAYRAEFFQP